MSDWRTLNLSSTTRVTSPVEWKDCKRHIIPKHDRCKTITLNAKENSLHYESLFSWLTNCSHFCSREKIKIPNKDSYNIFGPSTVQILVFSPPVNQHRLVVKLHLLLFTSESIRDLIFIFWLFKRQVTLNSSWNHLQCNSMLI